MPQAAALVVAKAVDTTDLCRVRCDVTPSCDIDTLDQQAAEPTTEYVGAQAGSEQLQKEHDLWLTAKQQELARLRQQQIVTTTVKTLRQLLETQFTQRLAVQSQCRPALHSSGGAVGDIVPETQGCVGLTACSHGSSSCLVATSPSGSLRHSQDSSSDSSRSSAADEAILAAESEDSADVSTASAESHNFPPADLQPDSSQQHAVEAMSKGGLDPLLQAATAAVSAALAGITNTQASHRRSSISRQTKPTAYRSSSRCCNREHVSTVSTAAAPLPVKAPCSSHSSIGDDSPRSTCTVASSTMAPSWNGHDERAYSRSNASTRPSGQQVSGAAAVVSDDDADASPPGFGAAVQHTYRARGLLKQLQPAAPPPPPVAAGSVGPPPPGFAAAVGAPPGFGGMKRVGSGYIYQADSTHHRPPTASRRESLLGYSHAGTEARSSNNTKAKKVRQSRLFQGALAGAMAERK